MADPKSCRPILQNQGSYIELIKFDKDSCLYRVLVQEVDFTNDRAKVSYVEVDLPDVWATVEFQSGLCHLGSAFLVDNKGVLLLAYGTDNVFLMLDNGKEKPVIIGRDPFSTGKTPCGLLRTPLSLLPSINYADWWGEPWQALYHYSDEEIENLPAEDRADYTCTPINQYYDNKLQRYVAKGTELSSVPDKDSDIFLFMDVTGKPFIARPYMLPEDYSFEDARQYQHLLSSLYRSEQEILLDGYAIGLAISRSYVAPRFTFTLKEPCRIGYKSSYSPSTYVDFTRTTPGAFYGWTLSTYPMNPDEGYIIIYDTEYISGSIDITYYYKITPTVTLLPNKTITVSTGTKVNAEIEQNVSNTIDSSFSKNVSLPANGIVYCGTTPDPPGYIDEQIYVYENVLNKEELTIITDDDKKSFSCESYGKSGYTSYKDLCYRAGGIQIKSVTEGICSWTGAGITIFHWDVSENEANMTVNYMLNGKVFAESYNKGTSVQKYHPGDSLHQARIMTVHQDFKYESEEQCRIIIFAVVDVHSDFAAYYSVEGTWKRTKNDGEPISIPDITMTEQIHFYHKGKDTVVDELISVIEVEDTAYYMPLSPLKFYFDNTFNHSDSDAVGTTTSLLHTHIKDFSYGVATSLYKQLMNSKHFSSSTDNAMLHTYIIAQPEKAVYRTNADGSMIHIKTIAINTDDGDGYIERFILEGKSYTASEIQDVAGFTGVADFQWDAAK